MKRLLRQTWVLALAAIVVTGPDPAIGRGPAPGWSVYADCAAAYLANARLADPDRPASMTAQVSDVADDYAAAAAARYRTRHGGSVAAARRAIQARVDRQTAQFGAQTRAAVERVIDACPQTGG
jgi:hypothetical protein